MFIRDIKMIFNDFLIYVLDFLEVVYGMVVA